MSRLAMMWRMAAALVVLLGAALVGAPRMQAQTDGSSAPAGETAAASGPTAREPAPARLMKTSMGEAFFIMRNPLNNRVEWVGTLIIWLLIALSISCTTLIGTLMWAHRRRGYVPEDLVRALRSALYDRRSDAAYRAIAGDGSMLAAVVAAGLRQGAHGHAAIARAAEQRADEISVRRLRSIEPLNIIGNVAPMLGLFGTVYGIILSFREIVATGGTPDPVSLAAGIGTALVATFWGLVVAIPALGFYGLLRSRIDALTVEAASTAEELLSSLKAAPAPTRAPGSET